MNNKLRIIKSRFNSNIEVALRAKIINDDQYYFLTEEVKENNNIYNLNNELNSLINYFADENIEEYNKISDYIFLYIN